MAGSAICARLPRVSVEVKPVASRRDLTRFIKLPMRLYRNEPNWIPPLVAERRAFLDRRKNPFFGHADVELFLAWRDGRAGGPDQRPRRPPLQRVPGQRLGPVRLLRVRGRPRGGRRRCSTTAEEWLRDRGRDRMVGPMDFTTNDECGLLIEGHERKPMILEGWHHPYYLELLEGWGLRKAMDLYMWELRLDKVEDKGGFHPLIHATAKKVTGEHGVTVRNMRRQRPRGRDRPLPRGLQRRLGAQLGVRAAGRDRGPLVREEPAPGPGRDAGPGSPSATARCWARRSRCPTSTSAWRT